MGESPLLNFKTGFTNHFLTKKNKVFGHSPLHYSTISPPPPVMNSKLFAFFSWTLFNRPTKPEACWNKDKCEDLTLTMVAHHDLD